MKRVLSGPEFFNLIAPLCNVNTKQISLPPQPSFEQALQACTPPKFGGIGGEPSVHYEKKEGQPSSDGTITNIKEDFIQSRKRSFSFDREQRLSRRESLVGQ